MHSIMNVYRYILLSIAINHSHVTICLIIQHMHIYTYIYTHMAIYTSVLMCVLMCIVMCCMFLVVFILLCINNGCVCEHSMIVLVQVEWATSSSSDHTASEIKQMQDATDGFTTSKASVGCMAICSELIWGSHMYVCVYVCMCVNIYMHTCMYYIHTCLSLLYFTQNGNLSWSGICFKHLILNSICIDHSCVESIHKWHIWRVIMFTSLGVVHMYVYYIYKYKYQYQYT